MQDRIVLYPLLDHNRIRLTPCDGLESMQLLDGHQMKDKNDMNKT